MKTFKKKGLLESIRNNKLEEFVSDDGNLVSSNIPTDSSLEVKSDITTDDLVQKARQKKPVDPRGGYYTMSFGMVQEEDLTNQVPQSMINNINELIDVMKDNDVSFDEFKPIANYIFNKLKYGE